MGWVRAARFLLQGSIFAVRHFLCNLLGYAPWIRLGGRAGRIGAIRSYECVTRMFRPSFLRAWFYRGIAVPYHRSLGLVCGAAEFICLCLSRGCVPVAFFVFVFVLACPAL